MLFYEHYLADVVLDDIECLNDHEIHLLWGHMVFDFFDMYLLGGGGEVFSPGGGGS